MKNFQLRYIIKKQNVIKKRWLQGYNKNLENMFYERLRNEIGEFKMDNLQR